MSKHRVLISAPYFFPVLDQFRQEFEDRGVELVLAQVDERLEEPELLELIPGVHGIVAGDDRITRKVIEAGDSLKVISKWGTGVDSFDHDAAREHGVAIRNTPGAFTDPVSDSAVGLILCYARNLLAQTRAMHDGEWEKLPGVSMKESVVGIVGVGAIGSAVARKLSAFGCRLLGYDPKDVDPSLVETTGIESVSLEELLGQSDFITLHCDLNPTSEHLLNDARFEQMNRRPVVINTARGPIISERALERALERDQIAGAALDVFEDEPLPSSSPLRGNPRVMMSAHNTNSSPAAWGRVHRSTLDNLFEELERQ